MPIFNVDEIQITNFVMFNLVFRDKELCKPFIERLLGIEISHLAEPVAEANATAGVLSRNVRFDVFVKEADGKKRVFNLEMQMANETDLALRSRYYQSIADTTLLKHGQNYTELKELYIIFLCNGDFVGENEVVAHAETIFSHSGRRLNDKVHKIFINFKKYAEVTNNAELRSCLEFLSTAKTTDEFSEQLAERVKLLRLDPKTRSELMTLGEYVDNENRKVRELALAEGRAEGEARGRLAGEAQGILKTAKNLLKMKLPLEKVQEATGLSLEELKTLK